MFKMIKVNTLTSAICYTLIGVILLCFPTTTLNLVGNLLAAAVAAMGVTRLIRYLKRDSASEYMENDLVAAVILLLIALFIFFGKGLIVSIIPFLLGIGILVSGIGKLQQALDLRRLNASYWGGVMAISVISMVFGLIMVFNPFDTVVTLLMCIGIGMIFTGVTDFIALWNINKRMKGF